MTVTQTPALAQSTSSPRTWLRRIIGGGQIVERCAAWCVASHTHDAHSNLTDLTHRTAPVSVELLVEALIAEVRVDPYSENPRRHVPYATFEATDGFMLDELGPEELAAIIALIRKHCDRLDEVVALLIQARAEYAAAGTA
jgi:hypothetical protein